MVCLQKGGGGGGEEEATMSFAAEYLLVLYGDCS